MHLSQEIFSNRKLKLRAKKLLYSANLDISCALESEKFVISAKGPVRFGPYSKTLSMQTIYKNNEGWTWDSHSFCPEDPKFFFEAVLQEEVIVFKTAKEKKELSSPKEKWWDVLSLLLQLSDDIWNHNVKTKYNVLLKSKVYEIEAAAIENGYKLFKKKKNLFSIHKEKNKSLLIHIENMNIKLKWSEE